MCANIIAKTKKEKILLFFKQGYSPKKIVSELKQSYRQISFKQVIDYLFILVGEGKIRRSDIWFSLNHDIRETIIEYRKADERNMKEESDKLFLKLASIIGQHLEEATLYIDLEKARVAHGDMYELISEIELMLHRAIKNVLIKNYGPDELEWWRKGVPEPIRKDCVQRREEDKDPVKDPFCYTNFIDLSKIIDKQWALFDKILPKKIVNDKKYFIKKLIKINQIRNRVMHPSKGYDFIPEDFDFVYEFHSSINIDNWQDKEIAN